MDIVEPKIKQKDGFAEVIIYTIARYYQVSPEQLYRRDKTGQISEARNFCYHFIRLYTTLTFDAIGELMHRKHSTVLQMDARIKGYMDIKNRLIFSKYLEIKYNIDEAVRAQYPKTFSFRISTFHKSESLT